MSNKRKVEVEEIRLVRDVPTGTFLKCIAPKSGRVMQTVYMLDSYDRSMRKYVAHAWDDIKKEIYLAGTRKVLVGFTL